MTAQPKRRACLSVAVFVLCAGRAALSQAAVDLSRVPGEVLTYIPSPSFYDWALNGAGVFTSDPEIFVLTNGWYLMTHTTFHGAAVPGDVYMFRSTDKGATWSQLPLLHNLSSGGSFFYHQGDLYLMGGRYIIRSQDNGSTWTTPGDTSSGVLTNNYASWTPNNPVLFSNRVWSAATRQAQSAPAESNLLVQASWKWSAGIAIKTNDWLDGRISETVTEAQIMASREQGAVVMPKIHDLPYSMLIRANPISGTTTFNPDGDFVEIPGAEKKFGGTYDPVSGKFYILSNPVLPVHANYKPWFEDTVHHAMIRNTAAVISSRDLYNWKVEKIFLYSANIDYEAFQYFNFDFDGPDMAIASRTAFDVGDVNVPPRGHDSNLITFHKISNFRSLAPTHVLKLDTANNQVLRYETTQHTDAPLGKFTLGSTFAGAALAAPNGFAQQAGTRNVYIRESGGRILCFDAGGNFLHTTNASPVTFQTSGALAVTQPPDWECAWSDPGSGDWNEPLSWYYWGRADTPSETAVFGSAATAAATVTIKTPCPEWPFATDGALSGWSTNTGLSGATVSGGVFSGVVATADPQLYRTDLGIWGSRFPEVRVRMRAPVTNTVFELYWGTSVSNSFAAARKLTATYTGKGEFQDLVFTFAGNPQWDGQVVTRLRLDPVNGAAYIGTTVEFDTIKVVPAGFELKGMRFRNANRYTLSGAETMRIKAESGPGSLAVQLGAHTADVPLQLDSDADASLAGGTSLHLKKGVGLNGKTLRMSGSGKLLLQGAVVMSGGTLAVNGSVPLTFTNDLAGAVLDGTLQFLPEGTFSPAVGIGFDLLDRQDLMGASRFAQVSLPALPAGMQWNTNALYSTGIVAVEPARHTLAVATPHGTASPAVGTNTYDYGTVLSAALIDSPVTDGRNQYVCIGWSGAGSVPAGGTYTNTGSFTLTNDSAVAWLWTTNMLPPSVTNTWDGGGVNAAWGTAENWDGDTLPAFGPDAALAFHTAGASQVITSYLGAARAVAALNFNANVSSSVTIRTTSTLTGTTARDLTFQDTAGRAAVHVESGASSDLRVGDGAGSVILASDLQIVHNGSGVLTIGRPVSDGADRYAVAKSGSGVLAFSSANTFDGGVTLSQGTLRVNDSGSLGTGSLTLSGGELGTSAAVTLTNDITLAGGVISNAHNLSLSGVIRGTGALAKSGAGSLTISGSNTYGGGTTISSGALALGHVSALGSGALTLNSGSLNIVADLSSGSGVTQAITLGANSTISFPTLALANSATFSGVIGNDGTARDLTLASSTRSNVVVTLKAANTYGGNTTFKLAASSQKLAVKAGVSDALSAGGTLEMRSVQQVGLSYNLNGYNQTIAGLIATNGPAAISGDGCVLTINTAAGTDYLFSGQNHPISGTMALVKTGDGVQRLSGIAGVNNISYSGGTFILGGTLVAGVHGLGTGPVSITNGVLRVDASLAIPAALNGDSTGQIDLNGGVLTQTLAGTGDFGGSIVHAGRYVKAGPGTQTFSGANAYSGGTVVSNGTLRLAANNALPSGGDVILSGGTLDMGSFTSTPASLSVTADSTLVLGSGPLTFISQTAGEWSGRLTLTGEPGSHSLRFWPVLPTPAQLGRIRYAGWEVYCTESGYIRLRRGAVMFVR